MADILVVAELADGRVRKGTLSAVTFARQVATALGGKFDILLIGPDAAGAVDQIAQLGASEIVVADIASKGYLCEHYAPTVAKLGQKYGVIAATATAFGKDLLPRVAAKLQAGYAADIAAVVSEAGGLAYKRPMFAGNAYGYARITTAVQVVTVRQSEFAPAEAVQGPASKVVTVPAEPPDAAAQRVQFVSFEQVKSERPELTDARVIVSGGRALKDKFDRTLAPLADLLGAAVGATRAACDAGFAPADLQVGQTGKIVAPDLYFAFGISGAIQHLAGMKSSKVIVAVNKDPEAPIFQVADYGLVADLFTVVPELVERLKAAK